MDSRVFAAYETAAAGRALDRYLQGCATMPGLGAHVRVVDTGGTRHLETTRAVEDKTVLTAFNPVGALIWGSPHRRPVKGRRMAVGTEGEANVYGPAAALDPALLASLLATLRFPADGFAPVAQFVSDAPLDGPAYPPHLAASYVSGALDENPYHGLAIPPAGPYSEQLVRTVAQITAAYLHRSASASNVFIATAKGKPTVLLAARPLAAGERLRSARTPLTLLGGNAALLKEVMATLLADGADQGIRSSLQEALGLEG